MKTIDGKRMCKLLEDKGWSLARVTGSHYIYIKEGKNVRISIPVHGAKYLKTGLQKFIMKLADIGEEEL